ncbi:MAG: PucR family transcriptional regulator ligand-binding domain-containing protein [bacterium]
MKVRDLLSINKESRRLKVIAGEKGLDREIFDIDVLEIPDGVYWTRENEFIITTGYFFRDSPIDLVKLIEIQNKKNVAGMGIKLGRFIDELPVEVIKKADECNFPLVNIPIDMGYGDLIWPVISYILGETRYEDYLLSNFKRDLNKTTNEKYYLNNLILMLNNYLESDIYILEKENLNLLANLSSDKDYINIKKLIQKNSFLANKKKIESINDENAIRIYKIFHHGIIYGYFGIVSNEFNEEKSRLEKLILKEIYTHVIIHILSYSKNKLEYTKSIEEFFIKLLNNKYNNIKMHLKEDAKFLGLNYYDKRIVLSLKIEKLSEILSKRELTEYIKRIFNNKIKDLYVIDNINNIVVIFTVEQFIKKELISLSKNIISKINLKHPDLKIKIGISKECGS